MKQNKGTPMAEVTFLIVDDDQIDVEIIHRAFKKLKIANPLREARDGIEALDVLRGTNGVEKIENPFIMLLDINMPRMSGLELLEHIREDEKLRHIVVFMLTTSDDEKDVLSAYEKNIAGYVVKSDAGSSFEDALNMLDHYWKVVELPPT